LTGGLVAALIALPYGLGMAALMGLPPALGIYSSLLTAPLTALFGRNPVLIGGTSTVTVPFLAVAVREHGIGGAAQMTVLAGAFLLLMGALRAGRQIGRVPAAVVSGFSCGIGGLMIASQLRTMLGLGAVEAWPAAAPGQLLAAFRNLGSVQVQPLLVSATVVLLAAWIGWRWPKAPAPLLGVVAATLLAALPGFHEQTVGQLPAGLPPLALPEWRWRDLAWLAPSSLGLAMVSAVNLLITSRVVEHFQGRHKPLSPADADRELAAYGVANLAAGAFGAPLSVGIPARSLANLRCGGSTRVSNLAHGVFLLAFVTLGSSWIARVPLAALAGVTVCVAIGLLQWSTWRRLPRMRRADALAFLATAILTFSVNAVAAIGIGCLLHVLPGLWRPQPEPVAERA
jgi:SulP family sulfate permease